MVRRQIYALAFALTSFNSCTNKAPSGDQITPEYDKKSGKLQLLKYDSNRNGKVDMWSYMDGSRVIRVEIDKDEDGKIDRWEYYDTNQKIEKVELSTRNDGKASRVEHYQNDTLTSAEEDTDGDGRIDKWETYAGGRLAVVAFDTTHRGTPDRRLVYDAGGAARVEVDPDGDGQFSPLPAK